MPMEKVLDILAEERRHKLCPLAVDALFVLATKEAL